MSFQVGVVAHFTARHHLVGDFGPARSPHEHAYRVDVGVIGGALGADGTLFDITHLQEALQAATTDLEGRDLNEIPSLADPNPTAEVVARYFVERIGARLHGQGLSQLEARIWESPTAYASYSGDLT